MVKLKTGIKGFDEIIGGGIESGSRNILYGPPGTGKTVFAMQFLWQGLCEGDFSEQLFALYDLKYMESVEDWTINWCHYDNIVNIDIMTAATQKDIATQRATDLDLNKAHNIFLFRFNEEKGRRELRILKMEGCEHPLDWIPFRITGRGIELIQEK